MAQKFPPDRFDQVPDDLERIGAHRAPRPRGYGWIWVAWCAVAVLVIVGIGTVGILIIDGKLAGDLPFDRPTTTASSTPTPTPTITPMVVPSLDVLVLNGTDNTGWATDASTTLKDAGWKNVTPTDASSTDVKTTTVYYASDADKAAALAVSQELAGAPLVMTQDYAASGAAIAVVIGANYVPTHQ